MVGKDFVDDLLLWWKDNKRDLPWKKTTNPYYIWISEVILQQTRVAFGIKYYQNFINTFPTIFDLANAPIDRVLKVWQGLGYYSRARNLHESAKLIVHSYNGIFPDNYIELIKIKGIGPYTAAAIASYAFNLPYAVVDGNVLRVLARINGIIEPIESTATKKHIQHLADTMLDYAASQDINQAMMDFSAGICKAKSPNCVPCFAYHNCQARQQELANFIPYKVKKINKTNRYFHYFDFILPDNNTIISLREAKDIWQGLYELPLLETQQNFIGDEKAKHFISQLIGIHPNQFQLIPIKKNYKQTLTHQIIQANFHQVIVNQPILKINKPHCLVKRKKVVNFAFPKVILDYLNSYKI